MAISLVIAADPVGARGNEAAGSFAEILRAHGFRVTPQRRAIMAAFAGEQPAHLSPQEVLRRARVQLPELARATVYHTLGEFVASGVLSVVDYGGSQLFERHVEEHQHFRCRSCGRLYNVHASAIEELQLDEPGFSVERSQIIFHGVCPSCDGSIGLAGSR